MTQTRPRRRPLTHQEKLALQERKQRRREKMEESRELAKGPIDLTFCLLVMLLTAIVSVLQFFLSDPLLIAIVRFVLGMLIGADYTVGIPLISEWASAKKRAGILGWLLVF